MQHTVFFLLHAWCIVVELSHEHPIGGFRVLVGEMGLEVFLHLPSTIELIGGSKIAAFHLAEDDVCVDEVALREVEVDACAQELFSKQRHIELV